MNSQIREKIESVLSEIENIEVVDVRFGSTGGKSLVQVLLDKEGGISLDDLTEVNRFLSREMDNWDTGTDAYMLEVSSAGLERPLTKLEHFDRFRQRKVKLMLHEPGEGNRKNYTGVITDVCGDSIFLHVESEPIEVVYSNIKKANLVYEFRK